MAGRTMSAIFVARLFVIIGRPALDKAAAVLGAFEKTSFFRPPRPRRACLDMKPVCVMTIRLQYSKFVQQLDAIIYHYHISASLNGLTSNKWKSRLKSRLNYLRFR